MADIPFTADELRRMLNEQDAEVERLRAALAARPIKPRHHPERLRKLTGEDGYHKGWQEALTALGNARATLAQEKPNGLRPDRRTNVAERLFGDD